MSSILEALRKVEATEHRRLARAEPTGPVRSRRLGLALGALAAAFSAGVALTVFLRATPERASAPTAAPTSPPAPELPSSEVPPITEAPQVTGAAPVAAPGTAPRAAHPPASITAGPPRPVPTVTPAPMEAVVEAVPLPPPDEPRAIEVLPGPPRDAPSVRVSFLVSSSVADRRSATLSIDGGDLVTLREGGERGGIELVRVLADRIHVRHAGRTFAVRAGD